MRKVESSERWGTVLQVGAVLVVAGGVVAGTGWLLSKAFEGHGQDNYNTYNVGSQNNYYSSSSSNYSDYNNSYYNSYYNSYSSPFYGGANYYMGYGGQMGGGTVPPFGYYPYGGSSAFGNTW